MQATSQALVAGGGIAGLSAAIVLAEHGFATTLIEQTPQFVEVGAGLQIGPNAWRCLRAWGLERDVLAVSSLPHAMVAKNLHTGAVLGTLPLGLSSEQRYGAPYATVLRADLLNCLAQRARQTERLTLRMAGQVQAIDSHAAGQAVALRMVGADGVTQQLQGELLLIADGAGGRLRQQTNVEAAQEPLSRSGYTAYRGIIRQSALPQCLRSQQVIAWLGKYLHAVTYPLRGNDWLNVVLIANDMALAHSTRRGSADIQAVLGSIERHGPLAKDLKDTILAVEAHGMNTLGYRWTEWPLRIRRPVPSPRALASGRMALLGDAAHPMVPFLAQGAAMAIEDAQQLGQCLQGLQADAPASAIPTALAQWARLRAGRVAKVQKQALRNGRIFHAQGLVRHGRDAALRLMGAYLMDKPWLFAGGPVPKSEKA
ncbi:FAD-dependent monooxygenase [Vandammella animalimorsus]|uniref:FAD-dependent monooxygenase n=1 Tax=Vandammella animalimorsus TaxID=2029117 RepID=UPI0031B9C8CD